MAKQATSASWQAGQSGNPKGRPPKLRALTTVLEKAGAKAVEVKGKSIAGRQLLARMVWQAVLSGRVELVPGDNVPMQLADGEPVTTGLELDGKQWVELVKFIYSHIDGPPKAQLEHSTNPTNPLVVKHEGNDTDRTAAILSVLAEAGVLAARAEATDDAAS